MRFDDGNDCSPSLTARLPPGRKQFWTSITSSADASSGLIESRGPKRLRNEGCGRRDANLREPASVDLVRPHPRSKPSLGPASIKPDDASALLVIDVQNCFLPGGSLAVKDASRSFPSSTASPRVLPIGDDAGWHTPAMPRSPRLTPARSRSKASISLWQAGAVARSLRAGTEGAALSKELAIPQAGLVIRKDFTRTSTAIPPSPRPTARPPPGLPLSEGAPSEAPVCRRARHGFCVAWTALDARKAGFETYVSKTPAAASIRKGRSPRPGPIWPRPASSASSRERLRFRLVRGSTALPRHPEVRALARLEG